MNDQTGKPSGEWPGSAAPHDAAGIIGEALKLHFEMLERVFPAAGSRRAGSAPSPSPGNSPNTWGTLCAFQKTCSDLFTKMSTDMMGAAMPDLSRTTSEILENFKEEFRKILNVPPLGLTRFYQERMNKTLDASASFQVSLSEFLQLLAAPLETASDAVQGLISQTGRYGWDSGKIYRFWIERLEESYQSLLKSEQYKEALARTLSALYEYREARKKFLLDLLQDWPVATIQDVDEIGRDLYLIKKRISILEKRTGGRGK